jgi:hypothetical protein
MNLMVTDSHFLQVVEKQLDPLVFQHALKKEQIGLPHESIDLLRKVTKREINLMGTRTNQ